MNIYKYELYSSGNLKEEILPVISIFKNRKSSQWKVGSIGKCSFAFSFVFDTLEFNNIYRKSYVLSFVTFKKLNDIEKRKVIKGLVNRK